MIPNAVLNRSSRLLCLSAGLWYQGMSVSAKDARASNESAAGVSATQVTVCSFTDIFVVAFNMQTPWTVKESAGALYCSAWNVASEFELVHVVVPAC